MTDLKYKYRIVQRTDNKYFIQYKCWMFFPWFESWMRYGFQDYDTLEEAREWVNQTIELDKKRIIRNRISKTYKVIETYE